MRLLIQSMIYAGSALMVYNIIRYGNFTKTSGELEHNQRSGGLLLIPLLLLVFFLIGYVAVAISGIADLMIASILFGGSVFVFLLLTVMYSIVRRTQDTDRILSQRYEEMKTELHALTKDSLAVFLVNLTKDEVEDRAGANLYESDLSCVSYTELLHSRGARVIVRAQEGKETGLLQRENLLQRYQEGQTGVSEVLLIQQQNGETAYVQVEATLTKMPVSGDVIAFIVERPYNETIVKDALLESVLMDQYDRIAYLVDGKYRVLVSNDGKKSGMLLPDEAEESYESLYFNYILPAQPREREKNSGPNPLRLSVIDKAMAESEKYDVNAPFIIDGETRYKHFVFYRINRGARFYLMLLSDSTQLQKEQMEQNQRLSDALAEAVRSNQARVSFFTNVSHNLRTPMNGILGFTGMAKTESDPQKVREYLDRVDYSARRLLSLMDDLFAMSMIANGTMQLSEQPTDLRSVAEKLGAHFAAERPEKALTIETRTDALKDPVVLCDEQRLHQLLSRLMENACAFAPEGASVSLEVRQTDSDDPACGAYTFCIRNCGVQIPPDVRDRIFDIDVWPNSEKKDELPGVGLGMAVAKAFVDSMGGTAEVSSADNGDTEFVIRLSFPLAAAEPEAAKPDTEETPQLHILLVDDNEINRQIAELMLTSEGWTVEKACDGAQAVKAVTDAPSGTYDLILMDVQMPVMNGYEATARIRALPEAEKSAIPIIAVTANAYQEDAEAALSAGMDGYVSKPIDPGVIRSVVTKVLNDKRKLNLKERGENT